MKEDLSSVNLARLLSELEGSSALLGGMEFTEEKEIIDLMKKRFYKMYFKLKKQENSILE